MRKREKVDGQKQGTKRFWNEPYFEQTIIGEFFLLKKLYFWQLKDCALLAITFSAKKPVIKSRQRSRYELVP